MLGIWFMPFACNHQTPEYKDHQHWFMKYQDGKPYETPWGGTSLDMTNPEVKSHVAALVKTIHSWGYDYFKMDGLWTGMAAQQVYVNDGYRDDKLGDNAPFHDPLKTNIEVFRDGLRLVREAAGPDVFLSGCNISQNMRTLGGAIGLVDAMRIGPDNGMQWGDYRKEIETTDGGHVVSGPIRGSRLYFLNGRVWWNDPDPYYVRDKIPLSDARLIASWVAVSGAFQLNSDWIPWLSVERLDILKRIMPAHGATARPIDYFDSILPSMWLVTDSRNAVRRDVLGLFNWETTEQTIGYSVAKAGLDPAKTYHAFDFWANQPAPSFSGQFSFQVPGHSCRVIAVRAADDHPVVVSTSRHISQGMIDLSDEQWRGSTDKGELTGTSHLIANDPYELRIAGLNDGGKWKLASVSVSPDDASAGVVIEPKTIPGEDGWLRVVISSKQTREVHWSVQFKRP
jgi:hypothetical protein